ncbi:hypothetical protein BSZ07_21750 [Streptomyces sp. M1013]|uniref:hypothetical protein n=1 Tax=Streptomyces sp. M1013 TaxID=549798 RepID=UPI000978F708|nr:hypothetical protein [Streptomyces sp. M1013]OMI86898.1 hypothetical protein BSZ07_21750 [Streptomyces sp. M1013]
MTTHAAPPPPDATSKATRLMCAGTYLDPVYRKGVIRELLTHRYRVVAPSYGYDAAPVLAHALAAHHLRRNQLIALGTGGVVIALLLATDVLGGWMAALFVFWLAWATMFLRRLAILQTLAEHLAPPSDDRTGFDGSHPITSRLTPELVGKINREQASETVYYGGYKPFVGAGQPIKRWANAELLLGAPKSRAGAFGQGLLNGHVPAQHGPADGDGTDGAGRTERKPIIPFTVEDITSRVCEEMLAELRDKPAPSDRVELLSVDRRRFSKAVRTAEADDPVAVLLDTPDPDGPDHSAGHWEEDYDARREYLCVRIGAWKQELVTSVFIGFDIKGSTLHTEFYTYVLSPLPKSFHLADRLPATIDGKLMWRIAWDVTLSAPGELLRLIANPLRERLPSRFGTDTVGKLVSQPADTSEFRLGRYALASVDCGALTSVRELAPNRDFHHFFQESDTIKYIQIIERHLLQIVGDFLRDHDVDTREHEANQTNILQQNFGANSTNNFGGNQSVGNTKTTQTFGNNSGVTREARQP